MSKHKDIKFCVWSSERVTHIHEIITRSCSIYPVEGCCLKIYVPVFCCLTFYGTTWTESQKSFCIWQIPSATYHLWAHCASCELHSKKHSQGHLGIGKICMQSVSSVVKICKLLDPNSALHTLHTDGHLGIFCRSWPVKFTDPGRKKKAWREIQLDNS